MKKFKPSIIGSLSDFVPLTRGLKIAGLMSMLVLNIPLIIMPGTSVVVTEVLISSALDIVDLGVLGRDTDFFGT